MIAKFYKLEWDITPEVSKMFDGYSTELAVKTKTDGNSNEQTAFGCELRNLSLPYTVAANAGVGIEEEIETIKSMLGIIAPVYIGERKLLSTMFMLTDVNCSNYQLTPDGQIISCEINLSFVEVRSGFGTGSLRVYYNGVDITNFITVVNCEHVMNAENAPDELNIKFADDEFLWDNWNPENNDTVNVIDGIAKTGKMYVQSVLPENGYMNVTAASVPIKMHKIIKENNKSWTNAKFLQILTEIAGRNDLTIETYDIENRTIPFVEQENMSDLDFIAERCEFEGYSFVVYDEKLIIYSPEAIEKESPVKTVRVQDDDNFEYEDNSINAYGGYEVDNGSILGSASSDNGSENIGRKIIEAYIDNQAEGNLYAQNLLNKANRALKTGKFTSDIMRDLSAASVVNLQTPMASSNNGSVFYTKIRNDYVNKKTEHNFRFL